MSTQDTISAAFPFVSKFVEVEGSQLHYVEEGDGDPILFLHGNPTSSYLWRNIIPHLASEGRCIALDLIGMGKSDKPDIDYRFFDHATYVEGFIAALGLKNLTLVAHDWGSALGFHYATRHQDNIKALAFMEAIIMPVPSWDRLPEDKRGVFQAFRTPDVGWDMIVNKNMFVEQILPGGIARALSQEEMDIYRAPFIEPESRRPLWRWPNEIPIAGEPADVVDAVANAYRVLIEWDVPKILFHAAPGAIIQPPMVDMLKGGLANLTSVDLGEGMHFLQEDHPHEIGEALRDWYRGL